MRFMGPPTMIGPGHELPILKSAMPFGRAPLNLAISQAYTT